MSGRLEALNRATVDGFVEAVGPVYEHSPHFARRAAARRPFASAQEVRQALKHEVESAPDHEKLALIKAHPDLVGRAVLTVESQGEQAAAGLTDLSPEEAARFGEYNAAYRGKFGFPFIICARLNKKDAILEAFPRRLRHDPETEKQAALEEIHKIAALRLHDILWES